jgi:predicted RecB family nuclease
MATRYDVSTVPPQGGYIAKYCPVRAQNDILQPGPRVPTSPAMQRRFDRGNAFEAEVTAQLLALHAGAVLIDDEPRSERAAPTLAAMQAGAPLILGGWLPVDETGRRVGMPDVLVAAPGGGYRPVDIKHHMQLDAATAKSDPARCSTLGDPALEPAAPDPAQKARPRQDDVLQLAHYQRMLESAGFAAADGRHGGIIGTEQRVVWYDLDEPFWRTPSITEGTKLRSAMERYDFEFSFRLDVMAVAAQHQHDPATALLVVPVRISECGSCPWWDACRPELESRGDVSLLPRIGWRDWKVYRDHGISTMQELAALDPDDTPWASTEHVDRARAALGDAPAYRRRGVDIITVPRADIEVDVDMENVEDGCYLWGAFVTQRRGDAITAAGYHTFATWEPVTPESETENSRRFWQWLSDLRAAAQAQGLTFAAYCYSASAENTYLRRLALNAPDLHDEVTDFMASECWVDMLKVWNNQLITGGGSGLKTTAPLAGHSWEVDDAGGAESMLQHDLAVAAEDPQARETARTWLLTYNRGDVEATLQLRQWLESEGPNLTSVEDLRP